MRQQKVLLDELGLAVAVVTFEADYFARAYVEDTGLDWPLLVDSKRELYGSYYMKRGKFWDIWGGATLAAYFKLLRRGHKLQESSGDAAQLGGDVLMDAEGKVLLHHVSKGPAGRLPVDEILQTLRMAQTTESAPSRL